MVYDPRGNLGMPKGTPNNPFVPLTGIDNPNQFLQNPPDFMSGGPHPMPNMPGQRPPDMTIFDPTPGGERKPGPGYFNDLVNRGGPPLSDEMRRKINEMVGARPPKPPTIDFPNIPDMPGDAGRGGEPTPPSDPFNINRKWNVDDTGVSVDTTDIYDAPYTVYNRYDPATDTYYGYTRNFAFGDGSKQPISMKGSEASQTFKDAWKSYEGSTGPSPTTPPDFPGRDAYERDYSGFSGEPGSGRVSSGTSVYDRYDPATDTYYGSIGGTFGNTPISVSGSEVGEEFKKAWAIANQGSTGPSPTIPPEIPKLPDYGGYFPGPDDTVTSCFIAGTSIDMADGSSKNIEDIIVGDEVNTQDGSLDTVIHVHDIPEGLKTLVTINDRITCTDSHPFLTEEGWKSFNPEASKPTYEEYGIEIDQLEVGDNLITVNGLEEVTNLSSREEVAKVYNFTTDQTHTYLVDGIVTHNKTYARPTGYGPDGETIMPMPDGFKAPSPGTGVGVGQALQPFYNPTTGQEWTATTGGYTPGPGWVRASKSQYEADPSLYPTDAVYGGKIDAPSDTSGLRDQLKDAGLLPGGPVPTAPETPATTDQFGQPLPRSPLDTLYGQIGVSDEAAARDVVNKILSGQTGDLTQAQRDLTGGGVYRRIANRLGMKDAAGNLITPFSSVQTESGNIATPEAAQVFQSLLDMENLEGGSGIELLLNHLRGRMGARPSMPQPQPGPFGLIPGRGGFGMPGMGGMYGGMYGMPRPPMFGSPYMSRMPFMNYAGMANPMNRSIFGGYGYGYGPGMGMAPLSYYGGYNSPQRQMFG